MTDLKMNSKQCRKKGCKKQPKPSNKVQERPDYDDSLSVRDNVLNLIYSFPEANPEEQ